MIYKLFNFSKSKAKVMLNNLEIQKVRKNKINLKLLNLYYNFYLINIKTPLTFLNQNRNWNFNTFFVVTSVPISYQSGMSWALPQIFQSHNKSSNNRFLSYSKV